MAKQPDTLTVQLMTRIEPSTRKRLDAMKRTMEREHRIRLSLAAVTRLAILEGLDALEAKAKG